MCGLSYSSMETTSPTIHQYQKAPRPSSARHENRVVPKYCHQQGFPGVHSQPAAAILLQPKNYHYYLFHLPTSPQVIQGLNGSENTCQKD